LWGGLVARGPIVNRPGCAAAWLFNRLTTLDSVMFFENAGSRRFFTVSEPMECWVQTNITVRWVLYVLVVAAATAVAVLTRGTAAASETPEAASSTVNLRWQPISGATRVRVYLLAEPRGAKTLLATLPGKAASHKADGLAPAATMFLQVEADTAKGLVSRSFRIRTEGGPRARLDNPVREVHACAPDILMIVLSGGDGAAWQSGAWSVTRSSGAAIAVRAVHRESLPVGAPHYEIGFGRPYSDDILDVDHRIYLSLAEPLGSADVLRIRGPLGVNFLLPFNDRFLETPVIHLNQVGYNPHAAKRYAYISGWLGDGKALPLANFPTEAEILLNDADATVLQRVPITVRAEHDIEAGAEVRQIDLSGVPPAEGRPLRVRLPGIGVSWPTEVSQAAALNAFSTLARGIFFNRWGGDLTPKHAAPWSRPPDDHHVYTGEISDFEKLFSKDAPLTGERHLTAGYHDAGDFEQRPTATVVPQLLMRAFEMNSPHFTDIQLNIPETGNGIPDLLNEALWGISGWEQLQEPDGGVRQGVQSNRHPWGFYLASDDPQPYWTFSRDADTTARVAGLFAQAARLVVSYNPARAAELKQRAIRAWEYADRNGAGNACRLYGAGELLRLTGDRIYQEAFEKAWSASGPFGAFSAFAPYQFTVDDYKKGKRAMADFLQGYAHASSHSPDIAAVIQKWLTNYAGQAVKTTENEHAYRNPRPEKFPMDWGQGTTMARFVDTVIARMQLGGLSPAERQRYFDTLSLSADYLLGGNPNGLVYITGLGSRHVEEPLHLDSLVFIKQGKGAVPGIPVFGPTAAAPKAPYARAAVAAFYPSFDQRPEALRYADVRTVPNFNEFSVWETQAPDAELLAILLVE
jgi:endoglucanase